MNSHLLLFPVFAILTNSIIPVPFEPVLLFYATKHPEFAIALIFVGSVCAAVSGFVDLAIAARIGRIVKKRYCITQVTADKRFYFVTFLFALLPLPFSFIRASLIKVRPYGPKYAISIFLGRLPRYLFLTKTAQFTDFSVVILTLFLLMAIAWITMRYFSSRRAPSPIT